MLTDGGVGDGHTPGPSDALRVAIVDDDSRVRRALKDLIESAADLEVIFSVGVPDEALLLDAEHIPDVVLLDMLLPTAADGLRVLQRLRGRNRSVVAISVLSSVRQQALDAGAFAFIEKDGREIDVLHDTLRAAAQTA